MNSLDTWKTSRNIFHGHTTASNRHRENPHSSSRSSRSSTVRVVYCVKWWSRRLFRYNYSLLPRLPNAPFLAGAFNLLHSLMVPKLDEVKTEVSPVYRIFPMHEHGYLLPFIHNLILTKLRNNATLVSIWPFLTHGETFRKHPGGHLVLLGKKMNLNQHLKNQQKAYFTHSIRLRAYTQILFSIWFPTISPYKASLHVLKDTNLWKSPSASFSTL